MHHRRAQNLQGEITAVVNHVRCKRESGDSDNDDEEEDTNLGFDFVASPPRWIHIQGSRLLDSNNNTAVSNANNNDVSDTTHPGNAVKRLNRKSANNKHDSNNIFTKRNRMDKNGGAEGGSIGIAVESSSSSPPSHISNQRSESPPPFLSI